MSDELFDKGWAVRRAVLGDAHVDRAEANKTDFDADFQCFIVEGAWGSVWARPGMDRKTRSLITVSLLAAITRNSPCTIAAAATRAPG